MVISDINTYKAFVNPVMLIVKVTLFIQLTAERAAVVSQLCTGVQVKYLNHLQQSH